MNLTIKRIFDLIIVILSFPILFILFFIIFLLILILDLHFPLFFQLRSGYKQKNFTLVKFKTMKNLKDKNNIILPDEKRVTKLGIFLRSTSLDELPTIYNVFFGNMSIVGPRPLLVEYNKLYNEHQIKRFNVKPGITGLAQINGRNSLTWDEKFSYDIKYVNKNNLITDIIIIIKTLVIVIKKKNINQFNKIGSQKFQGNKNE